MEEIINFIKDNIFSIIAITKDIMNIIFFIVTGFIGILTYKRAKNTILQPIKTEVFKLQIKLFEEIMLIFNGKSELELRDFFDMGTLINANIENTFDCYAYTFFNIKWDIEERKYGTSVCSSNLISIEYFEKNCEVVEDPYYDDEKEAVNQIIPPLELWKSYNADILYLPNTHTASIDRIHKIMKSPVLPKDAVDKLSKILATINENYTIIRKVLIEVSQEFPSKFPTLEQLKKADYTWVQNRINDKIKPLENLSDDLTEFLRDYLLVEKLLK